MEQWFLQFSPITQALIGTIFTWFVTALGAAMVFFFKKIDRKVLEMDSSALLPVFLLPPALGSCGTGH